MSFPSRTIRTTAAGALAAVVFAVAACGSDDSSSGSGTKLKGTTINYWASNQGATIDQDDQVINEAAARFKKETGVTVKHKVIPWSDLFTNITTATTSGKGPDVLNIGNTWSATLQATGAFIPFEGDDLKAVGGKEKFLETSFAASGAPGKEPTSVPLYGLSYGLFYNKKLFKEANLQPPKTWSEFVSTGKKLTKDTDGDGKPTSGASRWRAGASPRTPTSRSSSDARTAVSCSTATSRRSTPPRSSRASRTT